jgi:predicted DNA-binding transcriptional regulator AlpA
LRRTEATFNALPMHSVSWLASGGTFSIASPAMRPQAGGIAMRADPRPGAATRPTSDPSDAIEPGLSIDDLARVLNGSRSTIERMKAAGTLPRPDYFLGTGSRKSPRWRPSTIRGWIERGGCK